MTTLDDLLKMLNSYDVPRPHKGILCEVCKTPVSGAQSYSISSGDDLHPDDYVSCGNPTCQELVDKRHKLNRIELRDQKRRQAIADHQVRIDAENKLPFFSRWWARLMRKLFGE